MSKVDVVTGVNPPHKNTKFWGVQPREVIDGRYAHAIYPTKKILEGNVGYRDDPSEFVYSTPDERAFNPYLHIATLNRKGEPFYDARYLVDPRYNTLQGLHVRQRAPEIALDYSLYDHNSIHEALFVISHYQNYALQFETNDGLRLQDSEGQIFFQADQQFPRVTTHLLARLNALFNAQNCTQSDVEEMREMFDKTCKFGQKDAFYRIDHMAMTHSRVDICLGTSVPYLDGRVPVIHRIQFHPFGWAGIQGALENAHLARSLDADTIHALFQYQIIASMEDAY